MIRAFLSLCCFFLLQASSCSVFQDRAGEIYDRTEIGFGVYKAPDGYVYGPVKARLREPEGEEHIVRPQK